MMGLGLRLGFGLGLGLWLGLELGLGLGLKVLVIIILVLVLFHPLFLRVSGLLGLLGLLRWLLSHEVSAKRIAQGVLLSLHVYLSALTAWKMAHD